MARIIETLQGGQLTIPAEFCKELGSLEEGMLQVTLSEGKLYVKWVPVTQNGEDSPLLEELYEYFAHAREEVREQGYTEEEIDAAIGLEIVAVPRSSMRYSVVIDTAVFVRSLLDPHGFSGKLILTHAD